MHDVDSQISSHWDYIHACRKPDDDARNVYLAEAIAIEEIRLRARRERMKLSKAKRHLKEADVIEIRHLSAAGKSTEAIAKKFRVCTTSVTNIVARRRWRSVEG